MNDSIFISNYEVKNERITNLYNKANSNFWNPKTDIDWSIEIDQEKIINKELIPKNFTKYIGTPFEKWREKEWLKYNIEAKNYNISQLRHSEQAGLLFAVKLAEKVPYFESKLFASTQAIDEAKHLDVFTQYINKHIETQYTFNSVIENYLADILNDSRWDFVYLGGQVIGEGQTLSYLSTIYHTTLDPLLKQILRLILSDEARHVAFGVLSLTDEYKDLSDLEMKERQEFAYETSIKILGRLNQDEVWEKLGVNPIEAKNISVNSTKNKMARQISFSKIVPNCKKLGLLDRNDGWLRRRFEELEVIHFEDMEILDEQSF